MPRSEPGSSARKTRPAELGSGEHFATMGQMMAVSGADLVAVLHEAGFTREHAPEEEPAARMTRAGISVSFDTRGIVPPEQLVQVLTAARMSIGTLLDGMESVARRSPRKKKRGSNET